MLIVPYRAKNPPDSYPYCTIALIVINFIVFFCTTSGLEVTPWALSHLAVSHNTLSLWRLITAMFLHEGVLHIGGNMLFLWIFGAAVEGRLKHWKFLTIYFVAGIIGGLLSDFVFGVHEPDVPSLGASGAIMGLLGAYLYMFAHSYISVFWWFFIRFGITNWKAVWFIAFFIGLDILNGMMSRFQDGVGHVAHLSGFALGYVGAMAFRPHIDSEQSSNVKSTLSDLKQIEYLNLNELAVLLRQPNVTPQTLTAFSDRCRHEGGDNWQEILGSALKRFQRMAIDDCDPRIIAWHIMTIPPENTPVSGIALLRLGSRLEGLGELDSACHIYRRVYDVDPKSRDTETALLRLGRLLEHVYANPQAALETYRELLRLFPTGLHVLECQDAVMRLTLAAGAAPAPEIQQQKPIAIQAPEEQDAKQIQGTNMGSGRMIEL